MSTTIDDHATTGEQLARVAPVTVPEQVQSGVQLLISEAAVHAVKDEEGADRAAELLIAIKASETGLERARVTLTKPLNDHVKMINDEFRGPRGDLERVGGILKRRVLDYRAMQEAERRAAAAIAEAAAREAARVAAEAEAARQADARRVAAEEAQREREAALAAEAEIDEALLAEQQAARAQELLDAAPPVEPEPVALPAVPAAEPRVRRGAAGGSVASKMVWEHEIIDPTLVPREFLIIDEVAIRQAVRAGVREIAGCVIREIPQLAVKTR